MLLLLENAQLPYIKYSVKLYTNTLKGYLISYRRKNKINSICIRITYNKAAELDANAEILLGCLDPLQNKLDTGITK